MARSRSIDLLRALAIFLVCFGRHLAPSPESSGWLGLMLHKVTVLLERGGWVGVDLFFVLSGFLVSGLLFREHQKFGVISGTQFLIRRGLKIYPSFWLLMAFTIAGSISVHHRFPVQQACTELFFLQNYLPGVFWLHTWSLAVEEHFYFLLLIFFLILLRLAKRAAPFRAIPVSFAVLALTCLGLRLWAARTQPFELRTHFFPSHLRMDSLFFGVLISYFYHYHAEAFATFCRRFRPWLLVGAGVMLAPAFLFQLETTPFIYTFGLSLFYLGSGSLLMAGLAFTPPGNSVVRALAYVGSHSYSIYLWHAVIGGRLIQPLERVMGTHWTWPLYAAVYIAGSLALGIGIALLVEFPTLRIRDRWFPPRARPLETPKPDVEPLHPTASITH